MLGVPVRTIAVWAGAGKGPAYSLLGKHARYRVEDVERWIDAHRRDPEGGR
jgi:hypothetical protein